MLKEFRVSGFKNFEKEIIFKLDNVKNYAFNEKSVKNGMNKTSIIYGINGSGKSNLGYAIFDIVIQKGKINRDIKYMNNFLNLNSEKNAKFYYKFKFKENELIYIYEKSDYNIFVNEKLYIDDKLIIYYNHEINEHEVNVKGAENLNTNLNDNKKSFVEFVINNTNDNDYSGIFNEFFEFIDSMLFFKNLDYRTCISSVPPKFKNVKEAIIKKGKVKDFEEFLKSLGIEYELDIDGVGNEKNIYCKFNDKKVNLFEIASTGTNAIALFYAWLIHFEEYKFVWIDEFDAFYHNQLSRLVVEKLKKQDVQSILTTHNTSIMTNDLLRPDSYFIIENGKINNLSTLTEKELREAHNIEKMYKAGKFNE